MLPPLMKPALPPPFMTAHQTAGAVGRRREGQAPTTAGRCRCRCRCHCRSTATSPEPLLLRQEAGWEREAWVPGSPFSTETCPAVTTRTDYEQN